MANLIKDQTEKHFVKICNSFANFKRQGKVKMTLGQAKSRLDQLKETYELFKANHQEILDDETVDPGDLYFTNDIFGKGEDAFYTVQGEYLDHIESLTNRSRRVSDPQDVGSPSFTNFSSLPVIDIPTFEGKYENWENFRDMYRALIHHKPELPSIIKFQQLRTHLSGEALEIIKNIGIVEDNYEQAWKALLDYYDNNRRLVANYNKIILDAQPMKNGSCEELKRIQREMIGSLDSLIALSRSVGDADTIIALIVRRFDNNTHRDWSKCLGSDNQPPTLKRLREFVTNHILTLESLPSKQTNSKSLDQSHRETKSKSNVHQATSSSFNQNCPCCKGNHPLYKCEEFRDKELSRRLDIVKTGKRCFNCLGSHRREDCKSNFKCQSCKGSHHTLLHTDKSKQKTSSAIPQTTTSTNNVLSTNLLPSYGSDVLLATARVYVMGHDGQRYLVRALIDSCSQSSLISNSLSNILKLKRSPVNVNLRGVNDKPLGNSSSSVNITVSPRFSSNFKLSVRALIVPKVSSYCPPQKIKVSRLSHLQGLELADPQFFKGDSIDLLLSATVHAQIIENGIKKGPSNLPIASQSLLGWLISGPVPSNGAQPKNIVTLHCTEEPLLSDLLQKFWEVEEISISSDKRTKQEIDCETHFEETHSRDARGRFSVRLPFKENPKVLEAQKAESFSVASAMFKRLEGRFVGSLKLKEAYSAFIKEYVDLGHMTAVNPAQDNTVCYLPHHGVIREASSTTKLRVVFNGSSSPSKTGLSLNNCLHIGPNLLPNLFDLILRWRNYKYAFSADIEKMFRQIRVEKQDQKYQAILWRESPSDKMQTFQLTTVTYGLASSPYSACKVLKKLAECYKDTLPLGSESLNKEVYMDDVLSGGNTFQEAQDKIKQLDEITMLGCLPLRKWSSNHPPLLSQLPTSSLASKSLDLSGMSQDVSVLGLHWCPVKDEFTFKLKFTSTPKSWTKRTMLSQLAQFFDPLGWLAPTIITAKIMLQSLWLIKLNWDDDLPGEIISNWNKWLRGVESLNSIKIPRWNNISPKSTLVEVHGFADASKSAYAAVVYIRVVAQSQVSVLLQMAKTKVAPLKTVSIPRLELCAAQLLCRLVSHYLTTAEVSPSGIHLYSDSKVVLSWISAIPSRWPVFVANRCADIQTTIPNALWHYVKSNQNPADMASRGVFPSSFVDQDLWFNGPSMLHKLELDVPVFVPTEESTEEASSVGKSVNSLFTGLTCSLERSQTPPLKESKRAFPKATWDLSSKISNTDKLIAVTAYCLRFAVKCRCKALRKGSKEPRLALPFIKPDIFISQNTKELNPAEIQTATYLLVFIHQQFHFKEEISILLRLDNSKERECSKEQFVSLPSSSKLAILSPMLVNGLLRVGGRLSRALVDYDQKHPILLHPHSSLTERLVEKAHAETLHGGVQLTLLSLRQTYWIVNGRQTVRSIIKRCMTCKRYKGDTASQLMGDLPTSRVIPTPPFQKTGVDYAGPFPIRLAKVRGRGTHKGYIALFICMVTRAVHLEVVEDYSSEAFIAAFHRFTSRRGHCTDLYSDQGTNFIGASRELGEMIAERSESSTFISTLTKLGTTWHFNPPSAPHFGGLWEAAVKSTKFHLKRVVGEQVLTFVEFSTLLCRIEACLNSRPLIPLTDDPSDIDALTPSHFLIQRPSYLVPEPDISNDNIPPARRWKLLTSSLQNFWKRWSAEYLLSLQKKNKWRQVQSPLTVGDLVLIKNELVSPGRWPLGRVVKIFKDSNSLVRVAEIRTASSLLVRPITKLIIMRKAEEL